MLGPTGEGCSLFPGNTYINSCYQCLILKLIAVSCQLQHTFNQTRKHQFNTKHLEGAAELLGAVLWWCNFMIQEGEKGAGET